MRVTQSISNKQYLRNTNKSLENMLKTHNKVLTQKAYTRVSQDSINASKAMTTRRQMKDLEMYKANLSTAKELFSAAETNLYSVSSRDFDSINTKLIAACNSTYSDEQRGIFANELDELANDIIDTMNSDFAERQLFGGTSNGATPFTLQVCKVTDSGGNVVFDSGEKKVVCYNGVPVNLDAKSCADNGFGNGSYNVVYNNDDTTEKTLTLNFDDAASSNNNSKLFPGSNPIYVDIGMGIKYDSDYNVDPQTAMDISLNGAEMLGSGVDSVGMSKNLAQLVFDIADALKANDINYANHGIDRINNCHTTVMTAVTKLGAKQNSIDFYLDKNADYEYNLDERQNNVEGVDIYEEISNFESLEAAYNAALQLSAKVLPRSIFDFI